MRKWRGQGPPNDGYLHGLVALYSSLDLAPDSVAVEVGCWTGESAEVACQFVGTLHCVDPWPEPHWADKEPVFDARMALRPNVRKIKKPSHEASEDFEDEALDLVYLDGLHDYPHVTRDLLCWVRKVKPGGWVAGHDYDDEHPGVVRAVNEILGSPERVFSDSSWRVRKQEN